jgi:hypothetical protein
MKQLDFLKNLAPKRDGWQVGAALVFIAAGFVAIVVAWNGAAGVDFAQGQIPYLISGGAAGLALVGVGIALILFEGARRSRVHLDQRLDSLLEALQASRGNGAMSQNGHKVVPEGYVVVGSSSYHLPDCRLVSGKEEQQVMSIEEAQEQGLEACRVCAPDLVAE